MLLYEGWKHRVMYMNRRVTSQRSGESVKRFLIEDQRPVSEARSRRAGGPTRSNAVLEQCVLSSIRLIFLSGRGGWVKHDTVYCAKRVREEKVRHVSPFLLIQIFKGWALCLRSFLTSLQSGD